MLLNEINFPFIVIVAQYCSTKNLDIRIVAGVWCLLILVIIVLYNATLISYITSYRPQQLINSAEEPIRRPDVNLIVDSGLNLEMVLKVCQQFVNRLNSAELLY